MYKILSNGHTVVEQYSADDRVLIVGDWHGDDYWANRFIHAAKKNYIKTIVHVGDFGFWNVDSQYLNSLNKFLVKYEMILLFVDGNHEDHNVLADLEADPLTGLKNVGGNIYYIPRGHVITFVNDYDDEFNWMGFGGAASIDKSVRTVDVNWFAKELITNEQVNAAINDYSDTKIDVMITHDSPATTTLQNKYMGQSGWPIEDYQASYENQRKLDTVVQSLKPTFLYHGHHHYKYNEFLHDTHVIGLDCNNRNYNDHAMVVEFSGDPDMELTAEVCEYASRLPASSFEWGSVSWADDDLSDNKYTAS